MPGLVPGIPLPPLPPHGRTAAWMPEQVRRHDEEWRWRCRAVDPCPDPDARRRLLSPRFPPCLNAPPPSCPDLFRASTFAAYSARPTWMPGTSPGMTRSGLGCRALIRVPIRTRATSPVPSLSTVPECAPSVTGRTSPSVTAERPLRHARTCSGYPLPPLPPHGRMDARNKSGHDEEWVGMPGADPCPDPDARNVSCPLAFPRA